MIAGELVALFRSDVQDVEQPYLWTDNEAYVYLNDAYNMFVRFLGGVPDAASGICSVSYSANATEIDLSPYILRVVRAFRASDGEELSIIEHTDAPLVRVSGKLTLLRVGSTTGTPEFLVMGTDRNKAKLHPVPTGSGTVQMQVRRLPTTAISSSASTLADVAEEHHIHLVKWMKAQAYRKQDAETYDPEKAAENESLFLQYCSQAVYEQERLRRKSRNSLRSQRDLQNPLLRASASRNYESSGRRAAPQKQQAGGEEG